MWDDEKLKRIEANREAKKRPAEIPVEVDLPSEDEEDIKIEPIEEEDETEELPTIEA